MKLKYSIKYKVISILAIVITMINISGFSKANFIGQEFEISIGWTTNNPPYSYGGEEIQLITRSTDTNVPVYSLKENIESPLITTSDIEYYSNDIVKNVLRNGYGYKTYNELGLCNEVEGYLATQEAIFITTGERDRDLYIINDSQGERILAVTDEIIRNATNEKPDAIEIRHNTDWKTYEHDNNYVYKEYSIRCANTIPGTMQIGQGEGVILIDKNTNEEKQTFLDGDIFYIIAPKNTKEEIQIKFSYDIKSVYMYSAYNRTDGANEQYILAEAVSLAAGSVFKDTIEIETNIEILNQDEELNPIEGNAFSIIKSDNSVVHSDLVTNVEGKINLTLTNGKYYLKQTGTTSGYGLNTSQIEININGEENIYINVKNTKPDTEETTNTSKEINVVEETKNIVENNVIEVENVTVTNINKEVINKTNTTNFDNVNNFVNTINRKNIINISKENFHYNTINERPVTIDSPVIGENMSLYMTRQDYINYIDLIMLDSARIPILPVASK